MTIQYDTMAYCLHVINNRVKFFREYYIGDTRVYTVEVEHKEYTNAIQQMLEQH